MQQAAVHMCSPQNAFVIIARFEYACAKGMILPGCGSHLLYILPIVTSTVKAKQLDALWVSWQ